MKSFNPTYWRQIWQRAIDHHARTGKKTVSYFFMHMSVALLVSYTITQNVYMALSLSLIEPIIQTIAYAAHEHFWSRKGSTASSVLADSVHLTP